MPFSFQPLIPVQHIVGCALVVLLIAAAAYGRAWRRGNPLPRCLVLFTIRLLVVAGVAAVLLRPMRKEVAAEEGKKPVFSVLVDVSASMNSSDVNGDSRLAAVQGALDEGQKGFLAELGKSYDLKFATFDQAVQPERLANLLSQEDAKGAETGLAQGLLRGGSAGEERELAGLLVLSDGRENMGGDVVSASRLLKADSTPVWTVCVGSAADVDDIYVSGRLNQNFLFAEQPGTLTAILSHSGFEGLPVDVDLYREDEYLESRRAVLDRGVVQVEFPITEERKGVFKYRISVDPVASESETKNNARTVFVRVADEKLKILLVESRPHWDSKFLLRALQADPNLEVSSIFYVKPGKAYALQEKSTVDGFEKETISASLKLPRTQEELFRYDCLILGKEMDELLSADELGLLKDYLLDRGGSIVFYRGRSVGDAAGLGAIEPVTWADEVVEDVRLELTAEGRMSPVFSFQHPQSPELIVRSMPSLTSVTRIEEEKALAVVLAIGSDADVGAKRMAAISTHRYGQGKVMSISAEGLWRWSFLPSTGDEFESVYQDLWSQIIRWAAMDSEFLPNQDIAFSTDGYTFQPGDRMRLLVRTRLMDLNAFRPRIELRPPEGDPIELVPAAAEETPDPFAVAYTPEQEGEYTAVLYSNIGQPKELEVRFTVYADLIETRLVAADPNLLASVSEITGGDVLNLDELETLPERLRAHEELMSAGDRPVDVWDILPVLLGLIALLTLEWLLRRGWGML